MDNKENIIPFDQFDPSTGNTKINEGLLDTLSEVGGGLIRTLKQKFIAYFVNWLGIEEKSPLSKLVQEIFEEISVTEYVGLLSGDNLNSEFFIPKLADGFIEFLQRSGIDEIAEALGVESGGFLYNVIRETVSDKLSKRENFRKDVEDFLRDMLRDADGIRSVIDKDEILSSMSNKDKLDVANGIKRMSRKEDLPISTSGKGTDGLIGGLIDMFTRPGDVNRMAKSTIN